VAVLLLWALQRARIVPAPQVESLVYVEPAAPPPPPLGAPLVAEPPQAIVPEIEEKPTKPTRLVEPKPTPRRLPRPAPAIARGTPAGTADGVPGGVLGGVPEGEAGGVVGARGDAAIPAAQVAHPPVLVERTLPAYPAVARVRGIEGQVVLETVIGRDGRAEESITVLRSIPILDDAARDALRRWRFEPGRDAEGRPVRVLLEVPIRFQLR